MSKNIYLDNVSINNRDFLGTNKKHNIEKCNNVHFKKVLSNKLEFSLSTYNVYFIRNHFELYNFLIYSVIKSFSKIAKKPHIICNNMEHPYILQIIDSNVKSGLITASYVKANIYGTILAKEVEKNIKPKETCLIINSFINYLTGAINNVNKIGDIAHKYKIPLFCDCTFIIGIYPIHAAKNNIDAFSINFKSGDASNLSILAVKKDFVDGYQLHKQSIIFQEITEKNNECAKDILYPWEQYITNIYKTLKYRKEKNNKLIKLKQYFIKSLEKTHTVYFYDTIIKNNIIPETNDIVILGSQIDDDTKSAPHIISFVYINKQSTLDIEKKLAKKKIILYNPNNNFLFENIGLLPQWAKKTITLGFADFNTKKEIDKLIGFF